MKPQDSRKLIQNMALPGSSLYISTSDLDVRPAVKKAAADSAKSFQSSEPPLFQLAQQGRDAEPALVGKVGCRQFCCLPNWQKKDGPKPMCGLAV